MLEPYFVRPQTIDRIRSSWIGEPIERYVAWMREGGFAARTIRTRVPMLVQFGEFAAGRGARTWEELPECVAPFVVFWPQRPGAPPRSVTWKRTDRWQIQKPVEEMLQCVLPGFERPPQRPRLPVPFLAQAPGFFAYLRSERGLREPSVRHYLHFLRRFERFLTAIGRPDLRSLDPKLLREFIEGLANHLSLVSVGTACGCVRELLRYLFREQVLDRDLSPAVERPRRYRLDRVPRSIPWPETGRLLAQIDRRGAVGRRDFAMLLLLVTYGLRAHEVACLTLDDVDWHSGILRISGRKGGHSTHYRLTAAAGEALLDYLEHARPSVDDRHLFFKMIAPLRPVEPHVVSGRVAYWLRRAGISVPRPGAHTLRHTVAQHLLDHEVPLQQIGDYLGHRSANATQIYAKVDLVHLREIALGYGEEVLG